jgi:hypothetical protein
LLEHDLASLEKPSRGTRLRRIAIELYGRRPPRMPTDRQFDMPYIDIVDTFFNFVFDPACSLKIGAPSAIVLLND